MRCIQRNKAHACYAPGRGYCVILHWPPSSKTWYVHCVRKNGRWREIPWQFAHTLDVALKKARALLS